MALFMDVSQGPSGTAAAVANKTALPNLVLSQAAKMITRIWVTGAPINFNVAEPFAGYVIVESDDCLIAPLNLPFEIVPGFITVAAGVQEEAHKWIVNCPCNGGTTLKFWVVLDIAQTAACECQVTVEYSDGGSPYGSEQVHMTSGEPVTTSGAVADVAASLATITAKAKRLIGIWEYCMSLQPTADQGVFTTNDVVSSDFATAGPLRFSTNPEPGGIANMASGGMNLTVLTTDRPFRSPGATQTLTNVCTPRSTMTGNSRANWGIIWT